MNQDTAIFILSDKARAVKTRYEPLPDTLHRNDARRANDNIAKTMDPTIKAGDLVIVETTTRWGYTVVKVIDVDIDIDLNNDHPKWIVGKMSEDAHVKLKQQEAAAFKKVTEAEMLAQRKELRRKLEEAVGPDTLTSITFNGNGAPKPVAPAAPADDDDEDYGETPF